MRYFEEIGKDIGYVRIKPSVPILAGTIHTWKIIHTVGEKEIFEGGSIKIIFPNGFSQPLILPIPWKAVSRGKGPDLSLPGYITAFCKNKNVSLKITTESPHPNRELMRDVALQKIFIVVEKGHLKRGERIEIIYGDIRAGCPGAVSSCISGIREFVISVDPKGKEEAPYTGYKKILPSPKIKILPRKIKRFMIFIPSQLFKEKKLSATVVALDKYDNVAEDYKGKVKIGFKGAGNEPFSYSFSKKDKGVHRFKNIKCQKVKNTLRVTGVDKERKIKEISNPSLSQTNIKGSNLYWGDLHFHTYLSDGIGTPEENYAYARDIMSLDFAAIGDHDYAPVADAYLTDEEWEKLKEVNEKFYRAGKFVTFQSYEFSNTYGHRVVYFLTPNKSILIRSFELRKGNSDRYRDKNRKLWEGLKGKESIISVHGHSGFFHNDYNPKLEKIIQVYSTHGCYERKDSPFIPRITGSSYVQDYLAKGYRLAILAESDGHDGHPGYSTWVGRVGERQYRGGLAAIYAPALTRENIWNSLKKRHCYGTTGERIILDFRINNNFMGEELTFLNDKISREIRIKVIGTCPLDKIVIVRNNIDIYQHKCKKEEESIEWTDNEKISKIGIRSSNSSSKFVFYYVRVIQKNDHMAWSTPIWITLDKG